MHYYSSQRAPIEINQKPKGTNQVPLQRYISRVPLWHDLKQHSLLMLATPSFSKAMFPLLTPGQLASLPLLILPLPVPFTPILEKPLLPNLLSGLC